MKVKSAIFILTIFFCLSCTTLEDASSLTITPSPLLTVVEEVLSLPPTPVEESLTDNPTVYDDPNGLFTVAVPSGWTLDGPSPIVTNTFSTAVWQFVGQVGGEWRQVVIGLSHQFIEEGTSLEAWSEQHDGQELRKERLDTTVMQVNGLEAVLYKTRFLEVNRILMQTNIRCGIRVWFLSTYLADEHDQHHIEAYKQFVQSFQLIC